jgi:hypothetical protein
MSDELNRIKRLAGLNEYVEPPKNGGGWDDDDGEGPDDHPNIREIVRDYPELNKVIGKLNNAYVAGKIEPHSGSDDTYLRAILNAFGINPDRLAYDHSGNLDSVSEIIHDIWINHLDSRPAWLVRWEKTRPNW